MDSNNFIITIGRQFGSGGREIGQCIARKLAINYFDKELLAEAAKESGVNMAFFEKADEKSPSFLDSIFNYNLGLGLSSYIGASSPLSQENIYTAQSQTIEKIAEQGSCVIVGRTADYVLRKHARCINVFLHADINSRASRISDRGDCTDIESAKSYALKRDKLRAGYYNYYTDKTWGDSASYHITLDTTNLSAEDAADIIIAFATKRLTTKPQL